MSDDAKLMQEAADVIQIPDYYEDPQQRADLVERLRKRSEELA